MTREKELITHAQRTWESLYVGLQNYGIRYGHDYTDVNVNNSVMVMSFSLKMVNTSKWRKLSNLVPELSQAAQLKGKDKVRIDFSGLDYLVEVPKPRELHNTVTVGDVYNGTKGLDVSFGLSVTTNKPNSVNFEEDAAGHMMVSGSTRCGKTNILKIIAMCLMYNNSPDNMRIAVVDTVRSETYKALRNSAHLAVDILDTESKALIFLEWIKDMIVKLKGRKFEKKIVIIIDEVYLLIKNKAIAELLSYIASAGAGAGIHLVPATQYTKADEIGGRQFKGNLMTRVVGRVDDYYSSKNATGRDGAGAENLMAPGDFLVVDQHEGIDRIAVPHIDDKLFDRAKRGLSPIVKLNWDSEEVGLVPEVRRAPSVSACFDKIDPRLLHLAINGRHKDGRYFGADVIRKASHVLEKKGFGKSVGQGTANSYVMYAKRYRSIK